jgi:hypothetical protein
MFETPGGDRRDRAIERFGFSLLKDSKEVLRLEPLPPMGSVVLAADAAWAASVPRLHR